MKIFSTIKNVLVSVWKFIVSDKVVNVVEDVTKYAEVALPIVTELSVINPKLASLKEVEAAYRKYAVPYLDMYVEQPESIGNALLNLATELLRRKLGDVRWSTLQTAVQLAVTIYKAIKK